MGDPVAHIQPISPRLLEEVSTRCLDEVQHQDQLARSGAFGRRHTLPSGPNDARLRVLLEEVGEVARELNEYDINPSLEEDPTDLIKELVQVGACAIAWAAAILEGR